MAIRAGHIVTTADFDLIGIYALKTGDESVTSSTTLQNDDQLVLPLAANARYIFDGWLHYLGAATPAGDLKLSLSVPSGATVHWTNFGVNTSALTAYNVVPEGTGLAGPRAVGTNGATEMSCQPRGYLTVGSTSGNLQLQWAQNSSSATATTIKAGSHLRLVRVS